MSCAPIVLPAQTLRVTTSQYNNRRTGADVSESVLTPANVNTRQFGRLLTLPVDGAVYAQPLYLPQVNVPGKGLRDLLFVVTEKGSVYAFDASGKSTQPVWRVSLLPTKDGVSFPVPASAVHCPFISPGIGITSTAVIDVGTGTLFVLARSATRGNLLAGPTYSQRLHALAITTGHEKLGGPVEIRASMPGTGEGSSGGEVQFDPLRENPRAALLLTKGAVYLTWASSCDVSPYHGWVMAYDARTLHQLGVFDTSPDAGESGIWQSDTGPAADENGDVYVSTGNGLFDGRRDYGDSILKLRLQGGRLSVRDFFTPGNQEELNSNDGDLGSGGPLLLPNQAGDGLGGLVFGGKQGVLYDINPNRMGGLQRNDDHSDVQSFPLSDGIFSAAAYWNGYLYTFASADSLKQFAVKNGRIATRYASRSNRRSLFSGGTPTVSADGNGQGIVWIVETRAWNEGGTRAILRAYDALNVGKQLYSTDEIATRDQGPEAVRFTIPTVANGRVYVGGVDAVAVYGLLPQ